jgi:L-ascorbate metabolism protein UlaG (beta-lactamase superfamily)
VCSNNTASELKKCTGYKVDTARVVGITPQLCKSIDTKLNDMKIKILRLRHGDGDGQDENVGFIVDMGGINVFHAGDASGNLKPGVALNRVQEYDSIGIEKMHIEVAILNRGSFWNSNRPDIQIIKKLMKPNYIILSHFSEDNKQGEWEPIDQTIKKEKNMLPEIALFKWPMQSIIIRKGF